MTLPKVLCSIDRYGNPGRRHTLVRHRYDGQSTRTAGWYHSRHVEWLCIAAFANHHRNFQRQKWGDGRYVGKCQPAYRLCHRQTDLRATLTIVGIPSRNSNLAPTLVPITCSGGMPYVSSAKTRIKSMPPPETINVLNSFALK